MDDKKIIIIGFFIILVLCLVIPGANMPLWGQDIVKVLLGFVVGTQAPTGLKNAVYWFKKSKT